MNIEALNKELQEKAEQGAVKPSDFKQKTGTIPTPPPTPPSPKEKTPKKDKENGNKKNATVSAVVSYRVENIEGAIKDFDKDLAIFKDRVLEEFKQTEKTSLWKNIIRIISTLAGVVSAISAAYCAYKLWTGK